MGIEHLQQLVEQYSYIVIFGSMVLGLAGVPIPDEILLMTSGYFIRQGKLNYFLVVLVAVVGSTIGMMLSYLIGRFCGNFLNRKYAHKKSFQFARRKIEKYGPFAVIIGYYIPGVRHMTSMASGALLAPVKSYVISVVIGAFIWTNVFVIIGHAMGIIHIF